MIALTAPVFVLVPGAAQASVHVTLHPGTGGPQTGFVLRFRNPSRTGMVAGTRRVDEVLVSGTRASGCVSSLAYSLRPAAAGASMRTVVRPGGRRRWCGGRFHGRLVAYESTTCTPGPARACPLLVIAPQTLARFSFRVRSSPSGTGGGGSGGGSGGGGTGGGSGTGTGGDSPTFAGLQSATTACMGVASIHGGPPGRTYTLSWPAATNPVTPSSGIVYDIFFAARPGAENFSSPTWTTAPGATAYSGRLATSGSAYFVVRARDQAGHEDANTVEKLAVNNC